MKHIFQFKSLVLGAAALLHAGFSTAQSVTTVTTTAGTVSEFSPDTIIVRSESSPAPLRYHYSKTTTYVDEAGNPVSMETVKSGVPVTVYYSGAGDQLIADRIVVRRNSVGEATARIEERSTNKVGTVTDFGPQGLTIIGQSGAPVRYWSTSTTAYVDDSGKPVSVETVKSGMPVTVYYTSEGGRMIASRVVVSQSPVPVLPGDIIEKKTTKTTTTTTTGRVSNEKN